MKKIISALIGIILTCQICLPAFAQAATPPPSVLPSIVSKSYLVMNASTGQILISQNPNEKESPASLNKILTVALALETVDPESDYTITREDVLPVYPEAYRFGDTNSAVLLEGETLKVHDLIYGSTIQSVDDMANALADCTAKTAEHPAKMKDGSESYTAGFVEMMNQKANEVGCTQSHFINPHGIHHEENYTTVYDMALITRYAFDVPGFPKYWSQPQYTMPGTNKRPQPRKWSRPANDMMISTSPNHFDGLLGVQIGKNAGNAFNASAVAEKNGTRLICVALNCAGETDDTIQKDIVALLNYCFDNFVPVTFTQAELAPEGLNSPIYKKHWRSMEKIGSAVYSADSDFTMMIHKRFTKENVKIVPNIQGRYMDGEEIAPTLTFVMDTPDAGQYMITPISAVHLNADIVYDGQNVVADASKPETPEQVEEKPESAEESGIFDKVLHVFLVSAGILLALLILLLLVRTYNKRRYSKKNARKKTAQNRRKQSAMSSGSSSTSRKKPAAQKKVPSSSAPKKTSSRSPKK